MLPRTNSASCLCPRLKSHPGLEGPLKWSHELVQALERSFPRLYSGYVSTPPAASEVVCLGEERRLEACLSQYVTCHIAQYSTSVTLRVSRHSLHPRLDNRMKPRHSAIWPSFHGEKRHFSAKFAYEVATEVTKGIRAMKQPD